jgi:hypothetical protein
VKPSNILIDINGNAWLSDFGFAHVGDASMSLTGSAMIGTPAYIAPEVVYGNPATPVSDQYSLGVVLYQVSTGCLPYDADTPMAVAIKHASEPLPRPRWVNPNLPDAIEGVLLKVLSKEPEKRFNSISAFHKAFLCALNEAVDLDSGVLKPGARGQDANMEAYESVEFELVDVGEREADGELERKRRTTLALLFLSLLALPLTCWMGVRLGSGFFSVGNQVTEVAEVGSPQDMDATFVVLSTTLAPQGETMMATGEVETMVALTVTAMLEQGEGLILASITPTITSESEALLSETPADVGLTATSTESPPTATYTQSPPVAAGGPGSSNTPPPTNTLPPEVTPSATQIPADTHTPTKTQTPTVTYSPTLTITPTLMTTLAFTSTPTPTQTHTVTTTPSPPPDPCDGISIDNFSTPWRDAEWRVTNFSGSTITITAIWIDWPAGNDALERVEFGGDRIWFGDDEDPPSSMPPWFGWSRDRELRNYRDKDLEFRFERIAASTGYNLEVTFDNSCTIQTQD